MIHLSISERAKDFYQDPFGFVDDLDLVLKGNNLNIFQKYKRLQKTALWMSIICLAAWIIFGFDSTPLQFIHVLYEGIPAFILGHIPLQEMINIYNSYYGKEMHYSAFVIYLLVYYGLSKHYEALGIIKSKNVVYSFCIMFISVAIFEWFWILTFGILQNQPWVYTWKWPQARILLQNTAFAFVGLIGILYAWLDSFKEAPKTLKDLLFHSGNYKKHYVFRFNKISLALIGLCVISALFWIFYPGPIQQISVELETGQIWHSTRLFPQTLYTIDLNPNDSLNAGVWYYVNNDLIHAVNTIVKIIWAYTLYYIGKVRKIE